MQACKPRPHSLLYLVGEVHEVQSAVLHTTHNTPYSKQVRTSSKDQSPNAPARELSGDKAENDRPPKSRKSAGVSSTVICCPFMPAKGNIITGRVFCPPSRPSIPPLTSHLPPPTSHTPPPSSPPPLPPCTSLPFPLLLPSSSRTKPLALGLEQEPS